MSNKVVLIHGIRTCDPLKTMGGLGSSVEQKGLEVAYADYGYITIPLSNKRAVEATMDTAEDGDILVGFSNGGWAAWQCVNEQGLKPKAVVLISPALRRDREFKGIPTHCMYSEGDGILTKSKWWSSAVNILPHRWGRPSHWGQGGRYGMTSPDIINHQMSDYVSHSWYKHDDVIEKIADIIVDTSL